MTGNTDHHAGSGRPVGLARLLALLLALAMVAAACGGGDDTGTETGGDASTETTEADTEGTTEATEAGSETTEANAGDGGSGEGQNGEEAAAPVCDSVPTKTEGVLTVATGQEVYPPWMEDNDPSNGQGFESALVYALAERMGVGTVEWTSTGFDEAIVAGEKDYDFNIQQFSINDERDKVVDFSDGYYPVDQAIIGAADGPAAAAASLADLKDLRLGAAIGTTSLNYIDDVIQPTSDAAVYDDNAQATAAFNAGQVDAIVYDLPTAYYITSVELPEAAIIGILPQEGDAEELGMLFEDGSPLVDCVNAALGSLTDDGSLEAIQAEWLYQAGSIPVLEP